MKNNLLLLPLLLLCINQLYSQDCLRPSASLNFTANNIRTSFNNTAVFVDNSINDLGFENTNVQLGASTLFTNGIWLGAFDIEGNIKISAETYGSTSRVQFIAGPYPEDGVPDGTLCNDFDRFFTVTRDQIEAHILDYADNQVIDNPIPEIFGWPGDGNPEFEATNGFAMPQMLGGFAPFFDRLGDGIYDPNDGDYPLPKAVDVTTIPTQISWTIFNDAISTQSLGVEVQMTAWAYNCTDNELLNNTIFTSHKVINRSNEPLSDMRLGVWSDIDMGCPNDDYVGSIPDQNSYFGYNGLFRDVPNCTNATPLVREQIVSATFLNQELSSFINFYSTASPTAGFAQRDPNSPLEFYNYLNNSWLDGTPLTAGGTGYDPDGVPTSFAFPGNPNDDMEWSMRSANVPAGDQRALGVVNIDDFLPGAIFTLDVAYTSHHLDDELNSELIDPMYSNITEIQNIYDDQFQNTCTPLVACFDDCLWPGDANKDGIANYQDLLEIGLGFSEQGPARQDVVNWFARGADNWSKDFFGGINAKHTDCNGDGNVDEDDFFVTRDFYNYTNKNYQPMPTYDEGPELTLERIFPRGDDTLSPSVPLLRYRIVIDYPDSLYGLAYEIEYDTDYFPTAAVSDGNIFLGGDSLEYIEYATVIEDNTSVLNSAHLATVKTNGKNALVRQGSQGSLNLTVQDDLPTTLPETTRLRFKNVRAILSDGTPISFGGTTVIIVFDGLMTSENNIEQLPVQIYPNPALAVTHVDFNGFASKRIEMIDASGRVVKVIETDQLPAVDIDLSTVNSGIYFLKVIGEESSGVFRIVKQ